MLTIKPPIQLKCKKSIDTIHYDMEQKIKSNYALMNDSIRREELLHITASSPEIYFEQGSTTNILNEITSQSRQEFRLEVMNNLINRILMSNTENFTYQDSVYISNIMRKIGITDVNQFMKQVHNLQEEKQENYKLIQLYEENKNLLTQLFLEESNNKKAEKIDEIKEIDKTEYYLHNEIYNRLGTSNIYEEVRKFLQTYARTQTQVSRLEMNIAEQASLAQSFTLNNLKNEILNEHTPVYYYHNNSYEMKEEEEVSVPIDETAKLSSAVLLNLVDQVYLLKQQNIEANHHSWYSIENALFETVENTWKRYEAYHQEDIYHSHIINENIEQLSLKKQEEIQMLTEISKYYKSLNQQFVKTKINDIFNYEQNNEFVQNMENIQKQGNSYEITNTQLELQHLISDINEIDNVEMKEMTVEQIKEQLRIIDEKNLENIRKIEEIQRKQPKLVDIKVDKKKARQDALRALEKPEEVLNEYLTTERISSQEMQKEQLENQIYNVFSDETKAIFQQLEEYNNIQNPVVLEHKKVEITEIEPEKQDMISLSEENPVIYEIRMMAQKLGQTARQQNFLQQKNREVLEELSKKQQSKGKFIENIIQIEETHSKEMAVMEHIAVEMLHENTDTERKEIEIQQELLQIQKSQLLEEIPKRQSLEKQIKKDNLETTKQNLEKIAVMEHLETETVYENTEIETERKETQVQQNFLQTKSIPFLEEISKKTVSDKKLEEQKVKKDVNTLKEISVMEHLTTEVIHEDTEIQKETKETQSILQPRLKEILQREVKPIVQNEVFHNVEMLKKQEKLVTENVLDRIYQNTQETIKVKTVEEKNPQIKIEMEHPVTEIIYENKEIETKRKETQSILQPQLKEIFQREARPIVQKEVFHNVSLVHKQEEELITEDILDVIRQQTQETIKVQTVEKKNMQEHKIVETNLQQVTNQVTTQQIMNMEQMVQENVRKQIGRISEQVYGKIEKRLQTERKRRGF